MSEARMLGKLSEDEIQDFLREEVTGRIGCHARGRTYVVPVTFAYEGDSVFGHAAEGLKIRMMRRNPRVCFEVDRIQDLANWKSVIAQGFFEELRGQASVDAMDLLIARLGNRAPSETGPSRDRRDRGPEGDADGRKLVTYRIVLTEKTGRFERT
jgi:nitroimidazol reductase NimA-like FMN-containing flavoprotein (pyridoxamine 5'-phosphate oxidase superfamily)